MKIDLSPHSVRVFKADLFLTNFGCKDNEIFFYYSRNCSIYIFSYSFLSVLIALFLHYQMWMMEELWEQICLI